LKCTAKASNSSQYYSQNKKNNNNNNIFMQMQFDLIPASDEEGLVPARAR
jgi:hypothetical protein